MQTQTYGPHLILDCYGCPCEPLHNVDTIYRFLADMPPVLGMVPIGPPQLAVFDNPALAGVTGIIQIVTSHISVHTYALKGCLFMDLFSCKPFDRDDVLKRVRNAFRPEDMEIRELTRGRRFPANNIYDATMLRRSR